MYIPILVIFYRIKLTALEEFYFCIQHTQVSVQDFRVRL